MALPSLELGIRNSNDKRDDGVTDGGEISNFVDEMPALDSRFLRACVQGATPNVDMAQLYSCASCGYQSEMEVPLTADFFWPKR